MRKTTKTHIERKQFKRSAIAACVMTAFAVQAQAQTNDDPALLEEVVVYGIKQSLQNAQDIKREASTVKDVITSSDIGALPDKSIVEALQRVPGVAIERFEASNDPDHFAVEGGNVTVRGLNRTRSEINGRDSFSASGSGGLNFADISPQMVGAVEVVKSQSASMTEGGISGNINLITRKPFDSDDLVLGVTAKGQYSDLAEAFTPEISGLVSNTWDTDAGKFGALLSVTFSNVQTEAHGVGVYNYKQVTNAGSAPAANELNTSYFAPISGSARQQENDRDRLGIAGSLQWANPDETVQATLEFIRSDSNLTWSERFIEFPAQPFDNDATGSENINLVDATYDCQSPTCFFSSGLITGGGAVDSFEGNPFYASGGRVREDQRAVNDLSFNLEYAPNDNLKVTGDLQYISATSEIYDMQALARMTRTDTLLDLRSSNSPQFEIISPDGASLKTDNPDSYFLRSAMDFAADNEAEEVAFQLDGEYTFDEGLITAVKAGVRASNRTFDYQESEYNWGSVAETWMERAEDVSDPANPITPINILSGSEQARLGYLEEFTFKDHLGGSSLTINDTFYTPSVDRLLDKEAFFTSAVKEGVRLGQGTWAPLSQRDGVVPGTEFIPAEIGTVEEDRSAAYIQIDFGNEDADVPFSGNFGLRYISTQLTATGANFFGPLSSDGGVIEGELALFFDPANNGWNQYGLGDEDWMHPDSYRDFYTDTVLENEIRAGYASLGTNPTDEQLNDFWNVTVPGIVDANPEVKAAIEENINAHFAGIAVDKASIESYLNRQSGGVNTVSGERFTRILPSFNLKLGITDDFIIRLGASESIFLPTLDQVRNSSRITPSIAETRSDNPQGYKVFENGEQTDKYRNTDRISAAELSGFVANNGGNPYLQPELSTNYDLTFEWYFDDLGSFTTSFFHKRIRDYFRQSTTLREFTNSGIPAIEATVDTPAVPAVAPITEQVAITSTQNAGVATVKGFELAFTSNFGFIHENLENFGIQSSYTYIEGTAQDYGVTEFGVTPGDKYAGEFTHNNIRDLPLEGLSKDNANLALYYSNEDVGFETRFAYSWRSQYLLNSRDVIAFAPVYGEATGQLDWSASYQVTDNIKVGLEANNLLDEVTKTSIQNELFPNNNLGSQPTRNSPRSYFVNDRRFALFVQAQF